jgi:spore coat protein U-like protein
MRVTSIASIAFALCIANLSPALAASACTISNGTPLNFESRYDPFAGHPTDGRASFTVSCSRRETTAISLFYSHRLTSGSTAALHYDLFATPERLSVWGSGSDGFAVTRSFAAGAPTVVYVTRGSQAVRKLLPDRSRSTSSSSSGPNRVSVALRLSSRTISSPEFPCIALSERAALLNLRRCPIVSERMRLPPRQPHRLVERRRIELSSHPSAPCVAIVWSHQQRTSSVSIAIPAPRNAGDIQACGPGTSPTARHRQRCRRDPRRSRTAKSCD